MKKLLSLLMIAAFILVGCYGCVGGMQNMKAPEQTWNSLDPMGKAIILNETYTKQYDEYLSIIGWATGLTSSEVELMQKTDPVKLKSMIDNSNLNDDARNMLRKKKELLQKVEDPIDTFTDIAIAGGDPDANLEKLILDTLDQLKKSAYMR